LGEGRDHVVCLVVDHDVALLLKDFGVTKLEIVNDVHDLTDRAFAQSKRPLLLGPRMLCRRDCLVLFLNASFIQQHLFLKAALVSSLVIMLRVVWSYQSVDSFRLSRDTVDTFRLSFRSAMNIAPPCPAAT
jgi:hypothetical protein